MNDTLTIEKRPIVLTIIAWLIILGALFAPVTIYMSMHNPEVGEMMEQGSRIPLMGQYAMIIIGAIVGLWCAIGMLKGEKKARSIYIVYTVIAFFITFMASNMKEALIGTIIISFILLGLLYLPNINRYFNQNNA